MRYLFLAGLLLLGVSPRTASAQETFNHLTLKFSFAPPAGWVRKDPPPAVEGQMTVVAAAFLEPPRTPPPSLRTRGETNAEFLRRINRKLSVPARAQSGYQPSITVTTSPAAGRTLLDHVKDTRSKAAQDKAYRILGDRPGKLGGTAAVFRTVRLTLPNEPKLQTREVICLQFDRIYTVTLLAPVESFRKYTVVFEKVLASFVWKQ